MFGGIRQLLSPAREGESVFQSLGETLEAFQRFLDAPDQTALRAAHQAAVAGLNIPAAATVEDDVIIYCRFTLQGLALLSLLDEALKKAHSEDLASIEKNRAQETPSKESQPPPHFTPKALLSPVEEKSVHTLLQFVVVLGVFPFLLPGADTLLRLHLGEMAVQIKKSDSSGDGGAHWLYHHCRAISRLFSTPLIGPSVASRHLSTVLASFIQICHAPRQKPQQQQQQQHQEQQQHQQQQQQHDDKSDTSSLSQCSKREDGGVDGDSFSLGATEIQQRQCSEELGRLLDTLDRALVVRELLRLQGVKPTTVGGRGVSGGGREATTTRWLQRDCGRLLSSLLMMEDGVINVVLGIFDSFQGRLQCQVSQSIGTCVTHV